MTQLGQIDWNLVPALWALLSEQSVSRAARRLGVSQPAASGSLARLRRHFDDELLVREGNRYRLTPLGERLAPLALEAVAATGAVVELNRTFDPGSTTREFVLSTTEYGQLILGPELVAEIARRAPSARLAFRFPCAPTDLNKADLLSRVDGWVAPRELLGEVPFNGLLTDRWAVVASVDNPHVGDTLTLDTAAKLPWLAPTIPRGHVIPQLQQLVAHGISPHYQLASETFTSIPFLVAGTDRLSLIQRRLGTLLAPAVNIRLLECPWAIPPLHFTMWWRHDLERDPGHQWFRAVVADTMARLELAN